MTNTTNKMALEAAAKAEAMGWEVRIKLDQSDVIDYATVVAWAPGSTQVRYITFIEGYMSTKGWRDRNKLDGLLDYHLALWVPGVSREVEPPTQLLPPTKGGHTYYYGYPQSYCHSTLQCRQGFGERPDQRASR